MRVHAPGDDDGGDGGGVERFAENIVTPSPLRRCICPAAAREFIIVISN